MEVLLTSEVLLISSVLVVLAIFFFATYRVVNADEAHVIVFMGKDRRVYSPRYKISDGSEVGGKTSYFYIPFLMKRQILPLLNVKMDIKDIHLNDMNVAPFISDVISWLHIDDPIRAAERLNFNHSEGTFGSLKDDLINMVHAIARSVAMKQEVLDIMRDRTTFASSVRQEVDGHLKSWGVELVALEVNDIRDDGEKNSHIIANYEAIRKVQVESTARKEVAERTREAVEVEQDNRNKSEVAKASADEQILKRQIERDKNTGIAEQEKQVEIAKSEEIANTQKVLATRKLEVGTASVKKEAAIELATGEAEAIRIKGEKEAQVVKLTGEAEARATEAKGLAEATAKDAMAEALKKFNEAGISLEKIRAWVEVQIAQAQAQGKIAENAEIKIVNSGKGGNILGFDLNAENGANLGQMLEGLDLGKIASFLGKKNES